MSSRILFRILILLLTAATIASAQTVALGSYPVTALNSGGPNSIARGPDGALWFTMGSGNIGRMTGAGVFAEYSVPTPNSAPEGITVGPDGALWFTESAANNIGRITTAGVTTEFPVITAKSRPYGIAAGPDGALWFTEYAADQIGRITTAGVVTEYRNPYGAEPSGITAGPDGALWFTEYIQVARISTSGAVSAWGVPSTSASPHGIATGPDGALWFTGALQIGRITTAGAATEYQVFNVSPLAITTGPDGALWFTDSNSNSLGRITTGGAVTEYLAPPTDFENTGTTGITLGSKNTLWFTELGAGMVGQAVLTSASMVVGPSSGYPAASLGFSGSMFAPNETVVIFKNGIGSAVLATAASDSSGSFGSQNRHAALPVGPFGYRLFLAVGKTSGKVAAAGFSVTPKLSVNPNYGLPGTVITASGSGYGAFDTIKIYWESPVTFLGTAVTDSTGSFSGGPFTIPSSGLSGGADYRIDGIGTNVPEASNTATFFVQ